MDNWNGYEQLTLTDIFGDGTTPLRINRKIRLLEMFAGYGSQAMALARLGADFEHYRAIEFDAHAMHLYNVAHGTNFEPTDIRDITGADLGIEDKDKYFYIMTYSFPCQDISVAGKMRGFSKENQKNEETATRSGLLWEVERLLDTTSLLPDLLLMENVSQVHGKGNEKNFQSWIDYLTSKGYTSKFIDMNSRDYGIPQNRKRCFMLSWLGNYSYEFPKPIPLEVTMADYLEDEVDDKYYINSERAKKLIDKLIEDHIIDTEQNRTEQNRTAIDLSYKDTRAIDIANTISARQDRGVSARRQEGTGVCEYKL